VIASLKKRTSATTLPHNALLLGTSSNLSESQETDMDLGRGLLLWFLGVPIPVLILLALVWHH